MIACCIIPVQAEELQNIAQQYRTKEQTIKNVVDQQEQQPEDEHVVENQSAHEEGWLPQKPTIGDVVMVGAFVGAALLVFLKPR